MRATYTSISRWLSIQRLIFFFIVIIFGGIATLVVTFYRNNRAFHDTSYWLLHTHAVIEQAGRVASSAKDIQWESRTLVLTDDTAARHRYAVSRRHLDINVRLLANQTADDPQQQMRIGMLRTRIDSLLVFTDSIAAADHSNKSSLANTITTKLNQDISYTGINQLTDQIIYAEKVMLTDREQANNRVIRNNLILFIASGILIFILLLFAYLLLLFNLRRRRKAAQRIAKSEQKFRTLINSIKGLAIFTTDKEGTILDWYRGATNLKGYSNEEVVGKNISIFYTDDAIIKGEPRENLRLAEECGSYETQGWRLRKDGSAFWADVLITSNYDESGNLRGFTKVTRDFSTHKRAEDEINRSLEREKELNEMKSNFVSIASHEFRTPLSTILSSITLLEQYRTTELQPKRDRHIQRIRSSVSEMVGILEEFLSLEKIEEQKVSVNYEAFNLKELVKSVCDKFANQQRLVENIRVMHTGSDIIYLDKRIIEHVLTNLVSNAIKYSPENKEIVLATKVAQNFVQIQVKDQGIGISPADQRHLFERFFRASNTGNIRGTGLGLHIIKRYVGLLKGSIVVESELGTGSVFTVDFFVERTQQGEQDQH